MLNQTVSEDNHKTEYLDVVPSLVDVYKQAEERMLMQTFHTCMSELTLLQQKVVQAVLLEGVTEQEVARELGISQQSVNRIKRRAINRLKGCMEDWVNGTRT